MADESAGLRLALATPSGPAPACRYRPACLYACMDPPAAAAAVCGFSDHGYPGFYPGLAFTIVQGFLLKKKTNNTDFRVIFFRVLIF